MAALMYSVMAKRTSHLVKISIYYGLVIGVLLLIYAVKPEWDYYLPIGGLDKLAQINKGDFSSVLEEVVATTVNPFDVFDDSIKLFASMIGAIVLMLPIRWVYMRVGLTQNYNHSVAASLIILPLIVTGIVVIVQFSLALAFSLAGIVAGVRFRTTLKNTSDALFVFVAIGVGLAAGTSSLGIGLVMSVFFSYAVLLLPPATARASDGPNSPWRVGPAKEDSADNK
jgi:hypothetical protein